MKNVLITGFMPFGDYAENVSELAATELKTIGDYNVHGLVFPVRIFPHRRVKHVINYSVNGKTRYYPQPVYNLNYGDMIIEKAKEINACAIISLGMASDVKGIKIEAQAINWVENQIYCLDSEQRKVVDETFILKKELRVNLDKCNLRKSSDIVSLIEKCHESGFDCNISLSVDAGTFCCNALMFRTLVAISKRKCEIPYLFIHLPCSKEAVKNIPNFDRAKDFMSLEKLEKVLEVVLNHLDTEELAIDVIRRMNPGKIIPTGEELAKLLKN